MLYKGIKEKKSTKTRWWLEVALWLRKPPFSDLGNCLEHPRFHKTNKILIQMRWWAQRRGFADCKENVKVAESLWRKLQFPAVIWVWALFRRDSDRLQVQTARVCSTLSDQQFQTLLISCGYGSNDRPDNISKFPLCWINSFLWKITTVQITNVKLLYQRVWLYCVIKRNIFFRVQKKGHWFDAYYDAAQVSSQIWQMAPKWR